MVEWGPTSFAVGGGVVIAGLALSFAAYEVRLWLRRRRESEETGPEQQFRDIITTFNRLDQSVTADSLGDMNKGRNPKR